MNHKFNIVLVRSPRQSERYHSQCFKEVAYLLLYGLTDLGFEVLFSGRLEPDCINIILGYHALYGRRLPPSPSHNFIIYQLEELSEELPNLDKMLNTLRSPCIVWDFSEQNVEFLAQHGIQALYKPLGFHPEMSCIEHQADKDVDILFYGSSSDRRKKVLDALSEEFRVERLFGVYGEQRDAWIARAKIVLSVYYYQTRYFDDVRLSYLMNNRVFSIVEDTPFRKYADLLVYAPYTKLVDTCRYYLANEHRIAEQVQRTYHGFSDYPESEYLKNALLMAQRC